MNVFFRKFYWLSISYSILFARKILHTISSFPTIVPLLFIIGITTCSTALTWNISIEKKEQPLLSGKNIQSYVDLAVFASEYGDEEFSTKLFKKIQPLLTDNEVSNVKKSFYQEKTIVSMQSFWESLYTISPTSTDVLISLAVISYQRKDMEKVKAYTAQLKYVDPNNIHLKILEDL